MSPDKFKNTLNEKYKMEEYCEESDNDYLNTQTSFKNMTTLSK